MIKIDGYLFEQLKLTISTPRRCLGELIVELQGSCREWKEGSVTYRDHPDIEVSSTRYTIFESGVEVTDTTRFRPTLVSRYGLLADQVKRY